MVYLSCMTTTTSSSEPYRICCLCNEDVPADRVIRTEVGTVCADQYACEVRQGQRLADAPFVCVNCGHEHHYEDDTIVCEGKIFCEDEAACERRMERDGALAYQPDESPEDDGGEPLDWEDHIGTNCPDDMYPDDGDGYYDTEGW